MSAPKSKPAVVEKPKNFGWMAEYVDEHSLLAAARKVRDSGYTKTDAYTPFPVHGIDEALGIKPTVLPFIVLTMAFVGLFGALGMQVWMNSIDYPYIISGKPFYSIPAFIPVTYETTVLFSAFTTFFAMWALNGLPRFSNAVFTSPRFDRVTNDRFFLHVDSRDKYFNRESVKELLTGTNPESLEEVLEDSTPSKIPSIVWLTIATLMVASWVPASIVANMRAGNNEQPRWHVFFDMDFQPKKKAQSTTTIFADGRTVRPQVAGTIARGQLDETDGFYLGYDPSKVASQQVQSRFRLVSTQDDSKPPSLEGPIEEQPKPTPDSASDKKSDEPKKPEAKKSEGRKPKAKKDVPKKDPAKQEDTTTKESALKNEGSKKETAKAKAKSEDGKSEAATPATATPATATPAAATPATATPDTAAPTPVAPGPNLPWLTEYPIELNADMLALGKKKFEIYCSVCHGYGGDGDGLVHRRADQLQQGFWLPPTSLHDKRVRDQAVGNIFYTITKGKGKMANYAAVLSPTERWAIVMYVRALQRSRNADIEDVPVDQRSHIKEIKSAE